jgi:hypothetical protein
LARSGIEVKGTFSGAAEALEAIRRDPPDIVLSEKALTVGAVAK